MNVVKYNDIPGVFFCPEIIPARVYECLYVLEARHCWLNRY